MMSSLLPYICFAPALVGDGCRIGATLPESFWAYTQSPHG